MVSVFIWALGSVFLVSLISFIGVFTFGIQVKKLRKVLIYLISFSAGALFGDAFIHLLPEIVEEAGGFTFAISIYFLLGIVIFFALEKIIHWQHCHGHMLEEEHIHPFAYMILVGDGFHNFLDGIIIGASYLVSIPVGVATTIAVLLHEIPQEIGDFGVLIQGGFTKGKALLLNFASALLAVLGTIVVFLLQGKIDSIELILVPIAAGALVYIAGSDLIPELHKDSDGFWKNFLQWISFIVGIAVMAALLLLD